MKVKKVGIIGINGRFGRWLHAFFRRRRSPVRGIDVGTEGMLQDVVEWADVVIFCVPIPVTVGLMEKALRFSRPDQLWMDIASVKLPIWKLMEQARVQYAGLHPLFAPPKAETWKGCRLVVCRRSVSTGNGWLFHFLKETEAEIVEATAEEHDAYMLGNQTAVHAAAVIQALACLDVGLMPKGLAAYSTKLSRKQFGIMARMASQDPGLYADIQIGNARSASVIDAMIDRLLVFRNLVATKDRDRLTQMFALMNVYLGSDFIERAAKEFD